MGTYFSHNFCLTRIDTSANYESWKNRLHFQIDKQKFFEWDFLLGASESILTIECAVVHRVIARRRREGWYEVILIWDRVSWHGFCIAFECACMWSCASSCSNEAEYFLTMSTAILYRCSLSLLDWILLRYSLEMSFWAAHVLRPLECEVELRYSFRVSTY